MKLIISCIICLVPFFLHAQNINTIAGNGTIANTGDGGPASVATIAAPDAIAFDSHGNLFIATVGNDKIRKITPSGIIITVAGNETSGYNGDDIAATNASLNNPSDIAIDGNDNIYIADSYNNRIRKIDAVTGIINTIAGTGIAGFNGDGKPATATMFNGPCAICLDNSGNLFVSDFVNYRIRKISTTGIVSTVAGNGTPDTIGDGGMATSATIPSVYGICIDGKGSLYLAQATNAKVRKVDEHGIIKTIAGSGTIGTVINGTPATSAQIGVVRLAINKMSGELYIAGYFDNYIHRIDNAGLIYNVAGTGVAGFSGDGGPATAAKLTAPWGITFDTCGNLFIADRVNYRIRKVTYSPNPCPYLGIEGSVITTQLSIYPNPSNDILHIDNLQTTADYRLLSMVGAVQQQGGLKEGSNVIDITALPVGMYLVEVTNAAVGLRMMYKIVRQ